MITYIRNTKFIVYFWGAMALYLLNISVDSPDVFSNQYAEDLNFNDQESIVEIILEKVLGYKNAIPEKDDHDWENNNLNKKNRLVDIYLLTQCLPNLKLNSSKKNIAFNQYRSLFIQTYYLEIQHPPPEV